MKAIRNLTLIIIIGIVAAGGIYWYYSIANNYNQKARQILDNTGIQGGLVVHLNCKQGKLTAAFHKNDRYLVHGLTNSKKDLEKARQFIRKKKLYGSVTVEYWDGENLPYTNNLVNLLVTENPGNVSMDEIMRVLAPQGIACIKKDGEWQQKQKSLPGNTDEWTHHLHGSSNNAVAQDTRVAPPQTLQWKGKPMFSRSHELIPSIRALVSANGRIFYIIDNSPLGVKDPRIPSQWKLVARDAYNGVILWKRSIPGGTAVVDSECLVAKGERVYATLNTNASVSVLNAATGETIRQLNNSSGTEKIVCNKGILVLHRKDVKSQAGDMLQSINPGTGKTLWQTEEKTIMGGSLASLNNRVFYHNSEGIVALDIHSGEKLWKNRLQHSNVLQWGNSGKLVATEEAILFQNRRHILALSFEDGRLLWKGPGTHSNNPPLFVTQGCVWAGEPEYLNRKVNTSNPLDIKEAPYDHIWRAGGGAPYFEPRIRNTVVKKKGYDLRTGKVKRTLKVRNLLSPGHHFRCYPGKATNRYLLWNKRGVEFMDLKGNNHMRHDWLRGMCELGFIPANGFIYMPPHQCFCYPASKIDGFNAVSGTVDLKRWSSESASHPLEKGPAYGFTLESDAAGDDQWPMYRHDPARSGHQNGEAPQNLSVKWKTKLEGKLTQPVVARGKLFVSRINSQQICCLDSQTGKKIWSFTAGGKVDSSPTFYKGLLIFGSADGWVYCLRASDGELVWRFRGAPHERRIVSFGQVESSWPIHGSVLMKDDVVYFLAGRSSHIDGGMYLFGLNPKTGKKLYEKPLNTPRPDIPEEHGHPFEMEGYRSEILVSGDKYIYLRRAAFNKQLEKQETQKITKLGDRDVGRHLFCNTSLLNDSQWDRSYWMYSSRWPGYYFGVRAPKSGSILAFNDSVTFANKHYDRETDHSPIHVHGQGNLLYADNNDTKPILVGEEEKTRPVPWLPESTESLAKNEFCAYHHPAVNYEKGPGLSRSEPPKWSRRISIRTRAMVLTDSLLYVAGPPDAINPEDPLATFEGRSESYLQVLSTSGKKIATYKLDKPPEFDGMIAAENNIYLAAKDGSIQCLGK